MGTLLENLKGILIFKVCRGCSEPLPDTAFYLDKRSTDGLRSRCKKCTSIDSYLAHRRRNPPHPRGCFKCGKPVIGKRSDAIYCSTRCLDAVEKARYISRNPEYKARQRLQVTQIRHLKEHGHLNFINNPLMNPKDKYRVARHFGYRSMLEVNVARQLEAAGINPRECYERVKITYYRPNTTEPENEED